MCHRPSLVNMDDMEIDSIHEYDFRRARLSVSLKWLLSAAFGRDIPVELRDPLPLKDKDTVTAIYVNTGLVTLLVNSRLYILTCHSLFPHLSNSLQSGGHWAVIQSLSRLGVYVEDDHGQVITERELVQTNPFHLSAHLSLIEAIMTAYINTVATTERVVQAVKAVGPFNASEDLPIDVEDGLLVWMNKVSIACARQHQFSPKQRLDNNNLSAKVKVNRRHVKEVSNSPVSVQLMEDILKDISDGCSLCSLISFYCPNQLNYSDIHIAEVVGIGDSLHNISLVKEFCDGYLPTGIFHFTYEDILYSSDTIKPSLLTFITQLFYYFVVHPLDIVSPCDLQTNIHSPQVKTPTTKHPPVKSVAAHNSTNISHELISEATKKSFHPELSSPSLSRLSNNGDHYGSSSSLNTSANRLLHKRPSQTDGIDMHDTLSPIVVRKSQSMGILNIPDPKQSLVAWENKSYYIDRSKAQNANRMSTTSNGSTSLLSNVSFHDASDESDGDLPPHGAKSDISSVNAGKSVQRRQTERLNSQTPERVRSGGSQMSSSYQRLLDRSRDLESPLKQFAQKHGFQLSSKSSTADANRGEGEKPPSPEEVTTTEFTKVTPRTDSELSPRAGNTDHRNAGAVGQSYVISTALTADGAYAAGIPVIQNSVSDSCTEASLSSLADGEAGQDVPPHSPIQLIELSGANADKSEASANLSQADNVTCFADFGVLKGSTAHSIAEISGSTPPPRLKQRFEDQRNTSVDVKPTKRTTFSINQTTWSESNRLRSDSEAESDTVSEASEASADVRLLLEERRKAMAKKKSLEELERTKELNAASQQAFLKAVTKNKSERMQGDGRSEAAGGFSKDSISKTIKDLQDKWQHDQESKSKRVAATTSATSINVTPAALDNITELSESASEVESPRVPLPTMNGIGSRERAPTSGSRERTPSGDSKQHEAPVDVEQYGLEKLNASLSELKGEMKKLSEEQMRIEELQTMLSAGRPQSRSTPRSKNAETISFTPSATPALQVTEQETARDKTLHLSDLNQSGFSDSKWQTHDDSMSKSLQIVSDPFSHPNIQSLSQSTTEPFILHDTVKSSSEKVKTKVKKDHTNKPSDDNSPKPGPMKRTSSNGFLSSSQLSRRKTPTNTPQSLSSMPMHDTSLDQSAGRKKWSADKAPLFPGYDDTDYSPRGDTGGPELATRDVHQAFQPPPDNMSPARTPHRPRRLSAKESANQSDMKEETLHIQQLPGRHIPQELVEDTPMRIHSQYGQHHTNTPPNLNIDTSLDTPMKEVSLPQSRYPSETDTPMREYYAHRPDANSSSVKDSQIDSLGLAAAAASSDADKFAQLNSLQNKHQQLRVDLSSIDTPEREASHMANSRKQRPHSMIEKVERDGSTPPVVGYGVRPEPYANYSSPPTRDGSLLTSLDSYKHVDINCISDTPMRQYATSRYGAVSTPPQAVSRHGTVHVDPQASPTADTTRLVRAPYEYDVSSKSAKPAGQSLYKLNTPYGTADNELKPMEDGVSLNAAMDAIQADSLKQHPAQHPSADGTPFSPMSQSTRDPLSHFTADERLASPHPPTTPFPYPDPALPGPGATYGGARKVSSGSSEIENAFAEIGSNHSQGAGQLSRPNSSSHMTASALHRQQSGDNDDKASLHSYGSGSAESESNTSRGSSKPKRPTWDMSTPHGDLLNQPGVGFIVAGQNKISEEELTKRKEKMLMMQMKRREEQELKKQQKAADLAAKAEALRVKEMEAERKKMEEKAKKEAILQQFQQKKAEEDLPPEFRAQFRQRQKPKKSARPASIHWAGSSITDENFLRSSDNIDSAASFTVSIGSGNLTHRRVASPVCSYTGGNISSRSRVSTIEAPPDEYTGPKLYVKPSQKQRSNRTIIINAISHCCLAGVVNSDNKNKVLMELAKSDGKHFLILFRDGNQTYKAVYSFCPDSQQCVKVHGQGPRFIQDDMCHRFYKYNSGGKNFTEVLSTKHLSVSLDAVTIHNHLWQKKAGAQKKINY